MEASDHGLKMCESCMPEESLRYVKHVQMINVGGTGLFLSLTGTDPSVPKSNHSGLRQDSTVTDMISGVATKAVPRIASE